MPARLARFYRLAQHERRFLAAAWAGLVAARLALALMPSRTVREWAEAGWSPGPRDGGPEPERAAELVEAAARHHLLGTTCLTRAIALCALLRRRGHDARLIMGCGRSEGRFEAHAWVVCGDRALTAGGPIDRFAPLLDPGRAAGRISSATRRHIST
jgi:transglutaminase superfamily protein